MKKELSAEEYKKLVSEKSVKSNILKDCIYAFLFGGLICLIGQCLLNFYMVWCGLTRELASTAVCISLIFLSAVLTGLGVYDNIAKLAGAGTLVPITGFANAVVSPAMEFKSEGMVLGMAAKMFILAGPVIVYGTAASVVSGIVVYIIKMLGGAVFGG